MVDLDRRRVRALRYLLERQSDDGSFKGFSSAKLDDFGGAAEHHTVLDQAIILRALTGVSLAGTDLVRDGLSGFLLKQKSTTGSFNYWVRSSDNFSQKPYPDDLDDTACAWLALGMNDPDALSGAVQADIARLLISTEQKPGGPYRTWLVVSNADREWRDVDVAVNANAWTLLRHMGVRLAALEEWLIGTVRNDGGASKYYPGWASTIYFLAEKSEGELRRAVQDRWAKEMERGGELSALECALLVSTGVWLGADRQTVEVLVNKLAEKQQEDGSWPAAGFCLDPAVAAKPFYAGSPALTTALAIQALTVWGAPGKQSGRPLRSRSDGRAAPVWATIKRRNQHMPVAVQALAEPTLLKVQKLDRSHGVTGLAAHVLGQVPAIKKSQTKRMALYRNHLTQGSIYGWLAYTAADDVIDDDGGAELLPLIQDWTARMRSHFWQAGDDVAYQAWVDKKLTAMNLANIWEVKNTRLGARHLRQTDIPNYGAGRVVMDRAGGHIIAPVGALVALGYAHTSPLARVLSKAMKHLMLARQLHDDAHDWWGDLSRGQINMVAARLLTAAFEEGGKKVINLDDSATQDHLRQLFWRQTVVTVLADADRHLKIAQQCLDSQPELAELHQVYEMIESLRQSTGRTRRGRNQALRFWQRFTAGSAVGRSTL